MDFIIFLQENFRYVLGLHLVGIILGFGAALMADIFFFKFLKDKVITNDEVKILKTFSKIIWAGLTLIVLSGLLLFLSDPNGYLNSSKFLVKMTVVLVIIVNGLILNFAVTPKLTSINFVAKPNEDEKMRRIRRLAFATGAVSATSWWTAFILGVMQSSPAPSHVLLGIYLLILAGAIIGSQIFESLLGKLGKDSTPIK